MSGVAGLAATLGQAAPPDGVRLDDASVSGSGTGFAVGATYNLRAAGTGDGTNLSGFTWLLSGSASDYDVRATLETGDPPNGTFGTWLNLGSDRSWSLFTSSIGTVSGTVLLELRRTSAPTVILDNATITFTATKTA